MGYFYYIFFLHTDTSAISKMALLNTPTHSRYRQESSRLFQASTNMKKFLSYCSEVLTAYKIATELGFQDLAVNLLEGEAGSYLKDVAWSDDGDWKTSPKQPLLLNKVIRPK